MIRFAPAQDPVTSWPDFDGPLERIPRNRREVIDVFGNPGTLRSTADPSWVRRNIVELHGDNAWPGVPPRLYVKAHFLAQPYFREAFRRAYIACPEYRIHRAGCFVFRHIRHDRNRPLSLHSWGVAVDINPAQNRAIRFKRRQDVPEFFSDRWREAWPHGMPQEFVEAFLSVGFTWGGDWDDDGDSQDQRFIDPMHFQLTAR